MLEQQLEQTNKLLAQILERMDAGVSAPVAPKPDPEPEKPKAEKSKAASKPAPAKAPEPEVPADDKEEITMEDARSVLVTLSKAYGRAAALEVLDQFGAKKIGDVKPGDYGALLEACANYDQKEAA